MSINDGSLVLLAKSEPRESYRIVKWSMTNTRLYTYFEDQELIKIYVTNGDINQIPAIDVKDFIIDQDDPKYFGYSTSDDQVNTN